ncbi:MAG: glycosyltransferase family 9 protein [Bacteroidia bacterium]|nr:glycosyltransferase family 9 protein [Bacteroidia bacterium]MCX7651868.1 glycosyltransferase family 9 protein [Bacteroidia bacterium]MDW8415982.1 glycosyltransferase family 9 protein [Bacteroidia bacterium]
MARFLVIQTAFLGDAVLTLPLVGRLRMAFPEAEIHWVIRKGIEELFEAHPWNFKLWLWDKSWRGWWQLYRTLGSETWDAVLVVQRFFRMGLLGLSLPARVRITYDKNPLSVFYTHRIPHTFGAGIHEVSRVLSLLRPLGVSLDMPSPPWLFPPDSTMLNETYIIVSPTSRWQTKEAPFEYWANFLKTVPSSVKVYLTGLEQDRARLDSLIAYHPRVENLAGLLSLRELSSLVKGARQVYAVDSALTHIASALGVPTTTVFCSTVPEFGFGPLSPNSHIVQAEEELPCRPCGIHGKSACPKGHFRCGRELPTLLFAGA